MPLDPVKAEDTQAWLIKAAKDLRAAEVDLAAVPPLLEDVLFHCQQAVEKTLKAFLVWSDCPFRKTHDLGEMGGKCAEIDPSLEEMLKRAAPLTEYAWKFRYPGYTETVSNEEAVQTKAIADEVYTVVLNKLPQETNPPKELFE